MGRRAAASALSVILAVCFIPTFSFASEGGSAEADVTVPCGEEITAGEADGAAGEAAAAEEPEIGAPQTPAEDEVIPQGESVQEEPEAAEETVPEAEVSLNEMKAVLVESGYTEETADALTDDEVRDVYQAIMDGTMECIDTVCTEVDNIADMEAILSMSDEELISEGADPQAVNGARETVNTVISASDEELEQNYGMKPAEIKAIRELSDDREAIEETGEDPSDAGKPECEKEIKNLVTASGTISSSKMSYTQSVANKSTKKKPIYNVTLSYGWTLPYFSDLWDDVIVVGWGGNLNSKSEKGSVKYYECNYFSGKWYKYKKTRNMREEALPSKGYKFSFKQMASLNGCYTQPKKGSASLVVYQTKFKGLDTKLISNYCHRAVKIGSTSIGVSASGPSASISVGTAFDKSPQKSRNIRY